ncbi:programmed cell death protein 5 [Geosmithia morbida]|uniref:Programmed cell death protein 5 n=1 Tax=Geosmithia morbida TaxID=1094350 RepID=A0A9P4YXA4_9HYPO|nr:programmed cell death protein 5 [Geosmithia morbida]KAF4124793.1 programmed cell death protein 5 [Geosmithia morbida]
MIGSNNSYVPSVLLGAEAAKSPSVHKIHILGEDERSKFIAHALSGLYESVELMGWTPRYESTKYGNIQRARRGGARGVAAAPLIEKNAATRAEPNVEDDSHIDQLVVTGNGHEAALALDSVKHRLDKDSTVCLMNDGLGVLEDVRRKIFSGTMDTPDFLLGHMSHRLAYNRKYDSVRELRFGQLMLTPASTTRTIRTQELQRKVETRVNFVETVAGSKALNSTMTQYDQWLRFKLPSVIFNAVVEPVCVLLDEQYQGLLQNRPAERMMHRLLEEIVAVLTSMPELRNSSAIRDFVNGRAIRNVLYGGIMAKKSQPSRLATQLTRGLPTDVDYLNGYFIQRGQRLGLDLRYHSMMRDMVKARHSQEIEKLNSHVPFEETSVPSELGYRYRTRTRTRGGQESDKGFIYLGIRKARLEQLKAQGGGGSGPSMGRGGGGAGQEQQEAQRRKQEEARQHILQQILHPEAADRLGRIRLVKEQRATDVENRLIMLAQSGQLRSKVTEEQLKDLLNAVADNKEEEKIVVNRRKAWDDEDDDFDL